MVLEGATSDDQRFGEEPAFVDSDNDNDNSGSNRPLQYHVKIDQLPKPVTLTLLPASEGAMVKTILDNCKFAQDVLHRPLQQDEVDAIGYHFAKSLRTVSYGFPVGSAVGAYQAYRTMDKFRFPGYTPTLHADGGRFNPDKFGPLRGNMARNAWHAVRFQPYMVLGGVLGTVFFSSYATTVNAVETGGDPRLQDYINALRRRVQEKRGQAPAPAGQRNPVTSQEGQMDAQTQRAAQRTGSQEQWKRQDVQRKVVDYDEMSPTNGAWMDDLSPVNGQDTGLLTDDDMRKRYQRQQVDADTADRLETAKAAAAVHARNTQHDRERESDRASSLDAQQPAQSSYPKGSTWERIRREATHGQKPSRPTPTNDPRVRSEQQEGATLGDAFTFSATNEERQLAKTEAQKDFDARVERERRGGDFEESGNRGWRR